MIKNLLCKLGIHNWRVSVEILSYYDQVFEYSDTFQSEVKLRTCTRCEKKQVQASHCLGLNPPEFIHYWLDRS